jgi:hypothetical protein
MVHISRIPKNRILGFDPDSRPRSLNCDVIDKSSNDNSKHRHMLAIQSHLLYDTVPSPISIQVQVFNPFNPQSTSSRLTKTSQMDSLKNATGMGKAEPTEQQTKDEYNNLSPEQKKKQTYSEWVKENYNYQYERWMPWIEDQYLKWFGKGDNKASYATKGTSMAPLRQPPFPPRFLFRLG